MSRVAERHRVSKHLDDIPPKSDRQARVEYIWNRIREEARSVTHCQSLDPTKFVFPLSSGAPSMTPSASGQDIPPPPNYPQHVSPSMNATNAPSSMPSQKNTGRRASVSVQRLLVHNILSANSLLHAVTRRIATLCAASTSFFSQESNVMAAAMSPVAANNNNTTVSPMNNIVFASSMSQNGFSVELDRAELVEYFRFYNDWHFDDSNEGHIHDCFTAAQRMENHIYTDEQQQQQQQAQSLNNLDTLSNASSSQSAAALLEHPEHRDEFVLKSFNAQRQRFTESLEMTLEEAMAEDLIAAYDRDPAQMRIMEPLLYSKGFHALQLHRLAERLWYSGEIDYSLLLQSVSSRYFALDIHPAARIGTGVMIDHGTGVVIGETAVVGDNVSMLHNVTLGGTGKEVVDRHPKVGSGVLIGAGASILGNITIGTNARVAANAVVVKNVTPNCTMVGISARELPPRDFVGTSLTGQNTPTQGNTPKASSSGFPPPAPPPAMFNLNNNGAASSPTKSSAGASVSPLNTFSKQPANSPSGSLNNNNQNNFFVSSPSSHDAVVVIPASPGAPDIPSRKQNTTITFNDVVDAPPMPSRSSDQRSVNNKNDQMAVMSVAHRGAALTEIVIPATTSPSASAGEASGSSSKNNNNNNNTAAPSPAGSSKNVTGGSKPNLKIDVGSSSSKGSARKFSDAVAGVGTEQMTPLSKPSPPGVSMTFDSFVYEI